MKRIFQLLIIFVVLLFLILFTGCTSGNRIDYQIVLENRTLHSNEETQMIVNLTYNPFLSSKNIQEYSVSLVVNGDHLNILKDGNILRRDNAEVISFDKDNINMALNYTIQANYVYSGKFVETITFYLSTAEEGVVNKFTSDFITIIPRAT